MSRKKNKAQRVPAAKQSANRTVPAPDAGRLASKKAAVLGTQKKGHRTLAVVATCVVLLAGGVYFIVHGRNPANTYAPAIQPQPPAAATATQFVYPVTLFEDGNARHFEYKGPAGSIRYFILKSSDGVLRAAFDACDVCWRSGKGYYQVGDFMVCGNCGQRFASVKVNEIKGGCNPSPLNRKVEGDNVVIQVNDILQGSQYFNFSGRI